MRIASCFVDESGDQGPYDHRSPYYLVTLVFHDQSIALTPNLHSLSETLSSQGFPGYTIHAGPLIRREDEYNGFTRLERQRAFNCLFHFVRKAEITCTTLVIEKRQLAAPGDLSAEVKKKLKAFLHEHFEQFSAYDKVIVYYDNGQSELNSALVAAFMDRLNRVEFRKVNPADYKLFQAADMLCTLELLSMKAERKNMSNSERAFFNSEKDLQKNYMRYIRKKRI